MDRRTLIALSLSFVILVAWQKLYLEPRTSQPGVPPASATQETVKSTPNTEGAAGRPVHELRAAEKAHAGSVSSRAKERSQPVDQVESLDVETGAVQATNGPKILSDWTLKGFRASGVSGVEAIHMSGLANLGGAGELAVDLAEYAYISTLKGRLTKTERGWSWRYEDESIQLTRDISHSGRNAWLDVRVEATFKGPKPNYLFISLSTKAEEKNPDWNLLHWTNKEIERTSAEGAELRDVQSPVRWIGLTNRYFVTTVVNQSPVEPKGLVQPLGGAAARVSLVYPVSGSSLSIPLRIYFGPKDLTLLRSVDPTLDHAVDFGFFTVFAYPLLRLMKWFFELFGNYGVSIILLTLLVKVVTFPLTYKSMKSMKEMAKIQPQIQRLREKYGNDKEAMNREMLTLMRSHGYNPMAGCLPILVQMPVFFALYQVLYSAVELYNAPFALWIHDLASKDPYYVTPVLLTLTMFIQQKLTPNTATDPVQQKMIQFMPLIFGVFMITLPSGLAIYMLVNAIASIGQQILLNKRFDSGHGAAVTARA